MQQLIILFIITALIFFLTIKVWKKTKDISFLIGIGFIYYWTLLGAWFFIIDELSGGALKNIGLHYYYIEEKMFEVNLDVIYSFTLLLYGLFMISLLGTLLIFTKKTVPSQSEEKKPIIINHYRIIAISIVSVILSFILVYNEIATSIKSGYSVYAITRSFPNKFFTLHQLLNQTAVIALFLGLTVWISGNNAKYLKGNKGNMIVLAYIFCIIIIELYLLMLGNKREVFFAGVFCALLFWYNNNKRVSLKPAIIFFFMVVVPMFLNDTFRKISTPLLVKAFEAFGVFPGNIDLSDSLSGISASGILSSIVFSNEMFFGHFSMYGVLSHHLDFTYGTSIISLFASFVPRFLWTTRPDGIYEYYALGVHAMPGQGYTINHATAWYLNFGIAGVIAGAAFLGLVWITFLKKMKKIFTEKKLFIRIIYLLAVPAILAHIPTIIRSGPEVYKSFIFEALMIPVLIVFLSSVSIKGKKKSLKND